MRKIYFFVLLCLCFAAGLPVCSHAQGYLYVYAPDGQEQLFALNDVRKITFTEQKMKVHKTGGSVSELIYSEIDRLMLERWLIGNETIETGQNINVYAADGTLFVESSTELTAVNLYNMQGVLLQSVAPGSLSVSLPLQSGRAGVYIVQVLSPKGMSVYKIINQ